MAQVTVAPMHIYLNVIKKECVVIGINPMLYCSSAYESSIVSIHKHVYGLRLACLYDSLKPSDEDTREKIKYQWSLDKKSFAFCIINN